MKNSPLCQPHEHRLSRRRLLGAGALAGTALGSATTLGLGNLLRPVVAEDLRQKEKQVLCIWLDGGMSQLESWDPKPNTQFGGPFRAIPTSVPGVHVSELLPKTSQQMHHLAVLRSVCTQDNSHSAGVARINRGDPKNRGVVYPYLGSAVAKLMGPTSTGLPPYVWVKPGSGGFKTEDAGFLGPSYGALALGDGKPPDNLVPHASLTSDDYKLRQELRTRFNERFGQQRLKDEVAADTSVYDIAQTLMQRMDLFDESHVPDKDVQRYGTHELGRHLLMGRRLIEAGVRFVKVNSYHWDSHGDHFNSSDCLHRQFDQPFAALIEDLAERSMLDHVLVIVLSEFGRTPRINSHCGRDHWPEAWSVAMAGCGIQRGAVVGATNELGTYVDGPEHDIGHLFHTWFQALGIPKDKLEYDNHGQPLPVAHDECSAVAELLA